MTFFESTFEQCIEGPPICFSDGWFWMAEVEVEVEETAEVEETLGWIGELEVVPLLVEAAVEDERGGVSFDNWESR